MVSSLPLSLPPFFLCPLLLLRICLFPCTCLPVQEVFGMRAEDKDNDCVVCMTNVKDTTLLPCRHLCVCSECFGHLDKCPVCRAEFDSYVVFASPEDDQ